MSGKSSEISSLPSDILCKILSQMPTNYALLTKFLSRRWKKLSPFRVSPIHLDLDQEKGFPTPESLAKLVDKLFYETLLDVPSVESVYLRWSGYQDLEQEVTDDKFLAWVSEIIRRQVVRLELVTPNMKSYDVLLLILNNSATLVELDLWNYNYDYSETDFSFPGKFHLPNLKKLCLDFTCFIDASIDEVIVGCPLLTELFFHQCTFNDRLHIKSPLLKLLVISNVSICKGVTFDTPNLEVLLFRSGSPDFRVEDWSGADFESLQCAYIDHGTPGSDEAYIALAKMLKTCSRVPRLCYSADIDEEDIESIPLFPNVTWMFFKGIFSGYLFTLIACFLSKLPIVETLVFEKLISIGGSLAGYADFVSPMPTIPVCLDMSLKKIEFLRF